MSALHRISIEQLEKQGSQNMTCYQNDLIITNHVENLSQFKYPSRIDGITFLFCLSGDLDCSINLKRYHIEKGGILVNFLENIIQLHHFNQVEAYGVVISPDFFNSLPMDASLRSDTYLNIKMTPLAKIPLEEITVLQHYYILLKKTITSSDIGNREIIKALVTAFVHHVILLFNTYQPKVASELMNVPRVNRLFDQFMSYLSLYHTSQRSVKFYAQKMCLTPNYLSGEIKKYSGRSATEWINEYVILEAKTLLKFSGLNIQEVSYRLNFPNQSAFGKYFKQQTGLGPKHYRNMM